ncbi:tachylectin-2-like isoform X3 [Dendropsophus ebraccatus]|uniref:tachylectin-2-like isoform X3 n=1 Tax=Dendropsophus ebraccatus TaxID=150705 RepID=UPI0038313CF1
MADLDTLLLGLTKDNTIHVGLPPRHNQDSFKRRAAVMGKINNVSKLTCSPDGDIICVSSGDLYKGPLPSKDLDWFTVARRIGRFDWDRIKCLFFHPNGDLYCTTADGFFYKGPAPDNEYVPWIYDRATKIGRGNWHEYECLFFDPDGNLYGVANDKFYTGPPPTDENVAWEKTLLGVSQWQRLTHFMGFTKDKKLWAIDKHNGNIYRGDVPSQGKLSYLYSADCVGWNYNMYKVLSFTKDKTIRSILSLEFLIGEAKVLSETQEVVERNLYDNRKSKYTVLKHDYKINKTVKQSSSFSHEHGFTFEAGVETTFKTEIPGIFKGEVGFKMSTSTTHNWNMEKTNETETVFESNTNVEVEPGKAIKVVSSVMKAEMNVPYKAVARTIFGSDVEVRGIWLGVSHYNLTVNQEDFDIVPQ